MPALQWLRIYDRAWLRGDVVAGITLAAYLLPSGLVYFNVDHVLRDVLQRVRVAPPGLRLVLCDLSNTPYVDLAGTRMLARLHDELESQKVELRLVEAHASERDTLRAAGLEKLVGPIHRATTLPDALADFERTNPPPTA